MIIHCILCVHQDETHIVCMEYTKFSCWLLFRPLYNSTILRPPQSGQHFEANFFKCLRSVFSALNWPSVSISSGDDLLTICAGISLSASVGFENVNVSSLTLYGDMGLGRHMFRQCLAAWWNQGTTWTNVDLPTTRSSGIHLRALSKEVLVILNSKTWLKIASNSPRD